MLIQFTPGGFGQRLGPLLVQARQHQHKFLAAPAGHKLPAAQVLADDPARLAQHHVSGGVAVGVVDPLEVVDIDHHHTEDAPGLRQTIELLLGEAPVGQPREHVEVRGGAHLIELLAQFAHRVLYQHQHAAGQYELAHRGHRAFSHAQPARRPQVQELNAADEH